MSVRTVLADQSECPYALAQPNGGLMRCTFGWGHAGAHSWETFVPVSTSNPAAWEHQQADPVNHPPHYQGNGLEAIDVIEAFELGFNLGNTVKYILRAGWKGQTLEDLKKARWYLEREIGRLERTAQTSERTEEASGQQNKEEIG